MKQEIQNAFEILRKGGIILYPTDTVWGIGCDATNEEAVKRIYEIKKRTDSKSMLVLLDSENSLMSYVHIVPEMAWKLIEVTDKPLTIIYPTAKNIAKNLIAKDGSLGIRITKDEFCKKLIKKFKKPLVSTSANIAGEKNPNNFSEISKEIKSSVDYVVDWRRSETKKNKPSSIIKLETNNEIKIIR